MDSSKPFDSIPDDLLIKILSKLPAKSIATCRCVSKRWKSSALMRSGFHCDDFTFLTRSKARRRLLIGVHQLQDGEWSFYSTPLPRNPCKKSSSPATEFHIKFSKGTSEYNCSYASGLIYFDKMRIPREDKDVKRVICNPLTGQYVILPQLRSGGVSYSYLGFDPIDKEFKVLFMTTREFIASSGTDHYILTLGTGELKWRKIQCPFTHEPLWDRVCINGVLYYLALATNGWSHVIVCFDFRSEKFKLLDPNCSSGYGYERRFDGMINYKGKLCGIYLDYGYDGGFPIQLSMKVLEKREWSSYVYSLSADQSQVVNVNKNLSVVGMTSSGDIVLSTNSASNPFYVFYFNPERNNTLQVVEMQGAGDHCDWRYAYVEDYVEDISVTDDAMQPKSAPLQLGRNIVPERPKPQQRSLDLSKSSQSVENEEQITVPERPEPQRRRDTSPDLSKSPQFVKNKEQNGCGSSSSANLLYRSVSLAILCFGALSYVIFVPKKKK